MPCRRAASPRRCQLAGSASHVVCSGTVNGVEVIGLDTAPPPYQAAALEGSALLWDAQDDEPASGNDEPPFKIARLFDFAKPDTGPGFDPGHRVVTDSSERDRMLRYLTSGTTVLRTPMPARSCQPASAPMASGSGPDAQTDYETAVQAANFLLYPPPQYVRQAAWTPGAGG